VIHSIFFKSHVNHGKGILESHVGKENEQSTIDIHHTVLIHLLTKVNDADQ